MSNDPAKPEDNNVVALAKVFEKPDKIIAARRSEDGSGHGGDDDAPPGREKRSLDSPPFDALGPTEDGCYVFADAIGRIRIVKEKDITRRFMIALCSPRTDWLVDNFARVHEDGKRGRVEFNDAETFAFNLCSSKKFFDLRKSIRGRGGWRGRDGALVYHCGDRVMVNGVAHRPGEVDSCFYPAKSASPQPYGVAVGPSELRDVFEKLKLWNWKNELAPLFMMGWIAVAFLGAWLPVRPVIFCTGPRGCGKSTLFRLLSDLFKDMIVVSADATAMGAAQKLGQDSIPVALDELEADGDSRRVEELLKLITLSATGADRLRGSADHGGAKESLARSAIIAAAINVPALQPAARSRTAILELDEIKTAGSGISWDPQWAAERQRQIMRRLQDQAPYWDATAAIYRRAVIGRGLDDRDADVYATLFTGAQALMHDGVVSDEAAAGLLEKFELNALNIAEDNIRNEEHCLSHLLTHSIPLDGVKERRPVAEWIKRAARGSGVDQDEARHVLERYGMRLDWNGAKDLSEAIAQSYFIVANNHTELAKLFANTPWNSRAGATGGHRQALRKLRGAHVGEKTYYFAGVYGRATVLSAASVMADDDRDATAPESFQAGSLWSN